MIKGWVKLHRHIIDWEWYNDNDVKAVFLHCLLMAMVSERNYCGFQLQAGQFATTLNKFSRETGMSVQTIRTGLKRLEECGCITKKATNKFTLITVEKWGFYQTDIDLLTNKQQTNNKPTTRVEEEKKELKNNTRVPKKKTVQKTTKFANYKQREWDFDKLAELQRQQRDSWDGMTEEDMEKHQIRLVD